MQNCCTPKLLAYRVFISALIGWDRHLNFVQSQELCGNAFTSTVVASVLLAALVHVLAPVLR